MLRMKARTHRWLVWSLVTLGAVFMSSAALSDPDQRSAFLVRQDTDLAYLFLFAAGYVAAAGWWSTLMGWHVRPSEVDADRKPEPGVVSSSEPQPRRIVSLILAHSPITRGPEATPMRDQESDYDDEEATVPCPYCRREIHEDAQRCPYCEQYISDEDPPPRPKPWWLIIGVLACLYAVYRWITG